MGKLSRPPTTLSMTRPRTPTPYDPDKARELLAYASYPDGFKTQIVAFPEVADLMSLVKAWWADVSVDADIVIKDPTTAVSMAISVPKQWEGVISWRIGASPSPLTWRACFVPGSTWNISGVAEPYIDEQYWAMVAEPDEAVRDKMGKDLFIYALEKC